jgi:NitT/TauT family transport system permease protein
VSTAAVPLPRLKLRLALNPNTGLGVLAIVSFCLLWELAARFLIHNPLFLPPVTTVLLRAVELWQTAELQPHILTSLQEFLLGFGAAALAGILFAIAMAASARLRAFFDPWVSMLYSTPQVSLGPLFILWFGLGLTAKVWVIFLVAVFPILINTLVGLTTTDAALIEAARSFGANGTQVYTKIRLPAALPFIIAGLRLGVARGLVGVVVAELFGSRAGLGYLILVSAQTFDAATLFVSVLILAASGVLAVELLKWLERRMAPWRFLRDTE